ncbi:MAG: hypothetical protein ACTIIN_13495 [Brevibacterium aurantiacum]
MTITEQVHMSGFVDRALELTSSNAPWCRKLWRAGTVELAREFLEECRLSDISQSSLRNQIGYLTLSIKKDPGAKPYSSILIPKLEAIKCGLDENGHMYGELETHIEKMESDYFKNWIKAIEKNEGVDPDSAARKLISHIMYLGMHKGSIHAWLKSIRRRDESHSIEDFLKEVEVKCKSPKREYEFCVPVIKQPYFLKHDNSPPGWLSVTETKEWKKQNVPDLDSVRHQGSFMIRVYALDVNSAANLAREKISKIRTKFEVSAKMNIEVSSTMWSRQKKSKFPTKSTNRELSMTAFESADMVSDLELPGSVGNIISLIEPMRGSDPHTAVTCGWSIIESLFTGDEDESNSIASERFSRIVAASMVRAEFTRLAKEYASSNDDSISSDIDSCKCNLERAKIMYGALSSGVQCLVSDRRDQLAALRMGEVIENPKAFFDRTSTILSYEFRRLYRKRNMVAHAGQVAEANLHSVAETLTPLVGAGVDAALRAKLKYGIESLKLSGIVEARGKYLSKESRDGGGNILDILEFA